MLSQKIKQRFAHTPLIFCPTPLEPMPHLSRAHSGAGINLWIKRDDCTGLGAGGNKARQLEFYAGEALAQGVDTLITTGAIQSNHARMTVAAARKMGMACEIQLEQRVADRPQEYYRSGNPLLIHIMGAKVHHYAHGEDEEGADKALYAIAERLKNAGKKPYVIPLSPGHLPLGALGYMLAAEEMLHQAGDMKIAAVVLASGSGTTHAGLLAGLRALGSQARVYGICVRRSASLQAPRVIERCRILKDMLNLKTSVQESDILLDDSVLAPGYGALNDRVYRAIFSAGSLEGILLDPTYTGKAMAGLIHLIKHDTFADGENIVFLHSGGLPVTFAYPELMDYQP